jgi:predicted small integral membrane protein
MITRMAKILLLCALALFHSLVAFNNITDFNSNYQFVRHVLMMDSTFSANHAHWRAIGVPAIHVAFYVGIIAWEAVTAVLLWWGSVRLFRAARESAVAFSAARRIPILGLTLSMLMWLVAFLCVGGEWFLMWQSQAWNGQQEAFRMFVVVALVLLILMHPESEGQP